MIDTPENRVSRELQNILGKLNKEIEEIAGEPMGISLVIFNTRPGARLNYISTCDRKDVIIAWKELIDAWENKDMPDIPAHEIQ